ncbi:MAG: MarR family transcriptional regulator [Firmicutes bacterium]|nr:MarR family transcriptional regulator [Bacillota bacterium]
MYIKENKLELREQGQIDKSLFDALMSAHSLFHKMVFDNLRDTGLTTGQPKILEFLAACGSVMQKEIARACRIDPSTTARLLQGMEASGLILRAHMDGDRRAVFVSLTDYGQEMADFVKQVFLRCEAKAFRGIEDEAKHRVVEILKAVEKNLRQERSKATESMEELPEYKQLCSSPHYLFMTCRTLLQKQLYFRLADTPLTLGQPKILEFLEYAEGCQQKEIAKACNIEPATVTALLLNMEHAGFIDRRTEQGNRRSLYVYLTEDGKIMMEKTITALKETVAAAFCGMEERQKELKELLRHIGKNLKEA